jgi:hypothetical protein
VQTFQQLLKGFIQDGDPSGLRLETLRKAVSQMGTKLAHWTGPESATMDLGVYYRMKENAAKRIFATPDTGIASLGVESVHGVFQALLAKLAERGGLVVTSRGRTHGDLHGGNLLLDVAGNVWSATGAVRGRPVGV